MATITAAATEPARPRLGRRLYEGWLQLAAHFGEIQTQLIVCFVYLFVLGPMALAAALARQDLLAKRSPDEPSSAWQVADSVAKPDLERAQRLF